MTALLDRLATWWLGRRMAGERVAFLNTRRHPSLATGNVHPYLTQTIDGRPRVVVAWRDSVQADALADVGQPVAVPEGLPTVEV